MITKKLIKAYESTIERVKKPSRRGTTMAKYSSGKQNKKEFYKEMSLSNLEEFKEFKEDECKSNKSG